MGCAGYDAIAHVYEKLNSEIDYKKWADVIEEIKTVCWCGKAARTNARFNENGIIREGDQVCLGGNTSYIALCRKHWKEGNLGPRFRELLEEFN